MKRIITIDQLKSFLNENKSDFEIKRGKLICYNGENPNVVIPDGVKAIDMKAFNKILLKSIVIPNSVTTIEKHAFKGQGITSITIPSSVRKIGECAFTECENLTSVTILGPIQTIDFGVFRGCNNLKSVKLPNSLTTIGLEAFSYCINLTSITIPDTVTKIGNGAFSNCNSLGSIVIPRSVVNIGRYAFSDCNNLKFVSIMPSNVTIEEGAFSRCKKLLNVKINKSLIKLAQENWCFGDTPFEKKLEVSDDLKNYLTKAGLETAIPELREQFNEKQIEFHKHLKEKIKNKEIKYKELWRRDEELLKIGSDMDNFFYNIRKYKALLLWMHDNDMNKIHKTLADHIFPVPYLSEADPFKPLNEKVKSWEKV